MQTRELFRPRTRRISLTALIDVVFILLLFFMLTTSFQHWKQVELNVGSTAGAASSKQKNTVLLLTAQQGLIVPGSPIRFAHYRQLDSNALPQLNAGSVTLLPHDQNNMQLVINVLAHLSELGLNASLGESYGSELKIGMAK